MKKLSFIMAVLMIMMCMPMMFVSAADEAADATAPETVTDVLSARYGEKYALYEFASDEEAIAAGAIGRFTKEGGNGYALTWTAVGGQAKDCGATVFYLIKDGVEADALGRDTTFDVGGRPLIVDGSLGMTEGSTYGYTVKTGDRFLHADAATDKSSMGRQAGSVTFKNIYLDATAVTGALIQTNAGALVPTIVLDNVFVGSLNSQYGIVFRGTGKIEFNKVNMVMPKSTSAPVYMDQGSGQEFVVTNSVIEGNDRAIYSAANNVKVDITNSVVTLNKTSRAAVQINGGSNSVYNLYSGTFTGGYGFVIQNAPNLEVNIYGGTYNATANNGVQLQGNSAATLNVHGGVWNSKLHSIYVNGAKEAMTVNITGGTFIGNASRMIRNTGNAGNVINISGGTFISKNFDTDTTKFSSTPTPSFGLIFTELNNTINVSGGTFTAYKDDGINLATDTPFFCSWKKDETVDPKITISGGTFNGGSCFLLEAVYSGDAAAPLADESVWHNYDKGANGVAMAPVAVQGAAIRLNAVSGIRFTSTISGLTIKYIQENLAKEGTTLSYGTMIVPSNYIKYAGGELTMAALDKAGKAYVNIEAKDGLVENEDGSVTINASLVNIKKENYKRDFVAVAYIKYTDNTGAEVIKYAQNVNLAAFSRNVAEIAYAALADVHANASGAYTNEVSEYYVWNANARTYEVVNAKAYTRYSDDQLAIIKAYIAE